jgi:hypothetical protein
MLQYYDYENVRIFNETYYLQKEECFHLEYFYKQIQPQKIENLSEFVGNMIVKGISSIKLTNSSVLVSGIRFDESYYSDSAKPVIVVYYLKTLSLKEIEQYENWKEKEKKNKKKLKQELKQKQQEEEYNLYLELKKKYETK